MYDVLSPGLFPRILHPELPPIPMSFEVKTEKLASSAAPPNPSPQYIDCTDISKENISTFVSIVSAIVSLVTSP